MKSIHQTLIGADRPTPPPISYPALVRCLTFWKPDGQSEEDRTSEINELLSDLSKRFTTLFLHSRAITKILDVPTAFSVKPYTRGQVIVFRFFWHHIACMLRLDIHTEYVSLTTVLDMSITPDGEEGFAIEAALAKDRTFRQIYDTLVLFLEIGGQDGSNRLNQFLFARVWFLLFREVVDPISGPRHTLTSKRQRLLGNRLGLVLGDFRGVITGEREDGKDLARDGFALPFRRIAHTRGALDYTYQIPPVEWRFSRSKLIRRFLQIDSSLAFYEFTASALVGGRVIYMSALGPPYSPAHHGQSLRHERAAPVCFIIHSATNDPWDIGRLIDDLTRRGTLRLATLFKLDELFKANAALSAVGDRARALTKDLLDLSASFDFRSAPNRKSLAVKISSLGQRFTDIMAERAKIDASISGGLTYRLRRNLYYYEQFWKLVELSGEEPVLGYQPYRPFIERRLGSDFEYLRTLSTKFSELTREEITLTEAYGSLQLLNMTAEIWEAGEATRANTEAIQNEEDDIESIQAFGEGVLILVLVPYYMAHVLEGMLTALADRFAHDIDDVFSGASWFLGVAVALWVWRWRLSRTNERLRQKIASLEEFDDKKRFLKRIANLRKKVSEGIRLSSIARRGALFAAVLGAIVAVVSTLDRPPNYPRMISESQKEIGTSLRELRQELALTRQLNNQKAPQIPAPYLARSNPPPANYRTKSK